MGEGNLQSDEINVNKSALAHRHEVPLEPGRMFHSQPAVPCIIDQIPRSPLCSCEGSGVLVVPTS